MGRVVEHACLDVRVDAVGVVERSFNRPSPSTRTPSELSQSLHNRLRLRPKRARAWASASIIFNRLRTDAGVRAPSWRSGFDLDARRFERVDQRRQLFRRDLLHAIALPLKFGGKCL